MAGATCRGHAAPVSYLYSLYDALVSISVPSEKARAVVDAMERDMSTTLATKQDLERHALMTKQDLSLLATREDLLSTRQEVQVVRQDMENRFALQDQKIESARAQLEQKIDSLRGSLEQKIDTLQLRMTLRLGSMLFIGFGLAIAALRLWV